jgi:hypothetical protein
MLDDARKDSLLDQKNAFRHPGHFRRNGLQGRNGSTTRRSALTMIESISLFRMLAPLSSYDDTAHVCSSMPHTAERLGSRIAYDMN